MREERAALSKSRCWKYVVWREKTSLQESIKCRERERARERKLLYLMEESVCSLVSITMGLCRH